MTKATLQCIVIYRPNLNPLICDICKQEFDSLDKLGEHQKQAHDM